MADTPQEKRPDAAGRAAVLNVLREARALLIWAVPKGDSGPLVARIDALLRQDAPPAPAAVDGAAVEAAMMAAWTHNLRGQPKQAVEALERAAAMLRGEAGE